MEGAASLERQASLAEWSVIMQRLLFVSDVGFYARSHDSRVAKLASFADMAAEKTGDLSPRRLLSWLRREGMKVMDRALSEDRYERLSADLREAEANE
jgi:hypothetical protein